MMTRWLFSAPLLLLAGCSGGSDGTDGNDDKAPAAEEQAADAPAGPSQNAPAQPAPAAGGASDADLAYVADPSVAPPKAPEAGVGIGVQAIPVAIRGRWALKAEDCGARPGTDLTALVIDAKTLRFFESAGDLARVRDRDANRIVADYKFSGEGQQWDRLMLLGLADGGKTLVRRDYGDGAAPDAMRYTRCA